MLDKNKEAPKFIYIETPINRYYPKYLLHSYHQCYKCHKDCSDEFIIVSDKNNDKKYFCLDCVLSSVDWCKNCGEPFESDGKHEYCYKCREKGRIII